MRTSGQFSRWGPGTPASSPGGGFTPAPPRAAGREGVLPNASMAHVSAPTPPGRTARRQGNADLRSAQPRAARRARRTSNSGMVRTATGTSTGAAVQMRNTPPVSGTRFARLRRAVPTRGRRSLACCAMRRISSTRFRGAAGPRCRPSPGGGLEIGRPGLGAPSSLIDVPGLRPSVQSLNAMLFRLFLVPLLLALAPAAAAQDAPIFTGDFPAAEFQARRRAVMDAIGPGAIALLQGAPSPSGTSAFGRPIPSTT